MRCHERKDVVEGSVFGGEYFQAVPKKRSRKLTLMLGAGAPLWSRPDRMM